MEYIKSCYSYICETISNMTEYVKGVNKTGLEEENDYYCKLSDGGFVIKNSIPKTRKERIQVYRKNKDIVD